MTTAPFTLSGWLEHHSSKCGVRFFELACMEPYPHSLFLEVYGDLGREGDDDLNEDIARIDDRKHTVRFWLGAHCDPTTTPSNIVPVEEEPAIAAVMGVER